MPLAAGTRLGPYEILAPLGAGGMGEVYRARDTRLDRSVAIKVLPQHLSANPEVRSRFEREARAVSQLNHPNICTLHDVGHENGVDYLVLEHIEGETIAQRVERGPLPPPELLRVGLEIADALDRAHRAGIVHRDLKPGNVMLTKAGAKLLDFGLARATGLAPSTSDLTSSPTVAHALTAEGTILGTFQYMAPEQLEGKEADARSDLWALGCVLYEMATGKRAFEGRSQASLIAAILEKEPTPIAQLQPLAAPGLDRLVRACLAKDPDDRVQTAHDAKLQLQWVAEGGSQAGVPAPVSARRRSREALAWGLAALASVAALALGAWMALHRAPSPPVLRFEVEAPAGTTNLRWPRLSPDGRLLAFVVTDSTGVPRVWIRPLDALTAHPVAGTEGVVRPFWSPDGRHLAFILSGKLRKVPVAGGPGIAVGDAPGGSDGSWGARDVIAFDGAATGDTIRGIPASGGAVRALTRLDRGKSEQGHGWPFFLPDGRRFLYVSYAGSVGNGGTAVASSVDGKTIRPLGPTDGRVEFAPQGYLVFPRENTLMAQPFDAGALRTRGDAVPIGENVSLGQSNGDFSVSPAGVLAYRSVQTREVSRIMWVGRNGIPERELAPPAEYLDLALSPDGRRLAVSIMDGQRGTFDVWVRDLERGVSTRLTFEPGEEFNPVWSPDGQRVAYSSDAGGQFRVMHRLANGLGVVDSIVAGDGAAWGPSDWSRDGQRLALRRFAASRGWDVATASLAPGAKPAEFVAGPSNEQWAQFSPDGRWIAYQSTESGRPEVYVQASDGAAGRWQVSANGGSVPRWRADGRELFFQSLDQTIMAAPVALGPTFSSGTPNALFRVVLPDGRYTGYRWTVSADGQHFVVITPATDRRPATITVVTNWTEGLKER